MVPARAICKGICQKKPVLRDSSKQGLSRHRSGNCAALNAKPSTWNQTLVCKLFHKCSWIENWSVLNVSSNKNILKIFWKYFDLLAAENILECHWPVTCAQLQALLCQLSWLLMATAKIKDICDYQWTLFINLVNSHAWWVGHDDASSDVIPTDSSWLLPSSPTPSSPSSSSQTSSGNSKHVGISGLRQIWNIAVPETSLPSSSYPRQTSFDEEIHLHCCHPGLWGKKEELVIIREEREIGLVIHQGWTIRIGIGWNE